MDTVFPPNATLCTRKNKSSIHLIKVSEHGLGLYYRPKEGRDAECEVATWIKEGWEWILNRDLGFPFPTPEWFRLPVMRRIAITTPNVMAALRRLRRDQARPYNFALSPVLVNLTGTPITLLAPFEKDSSRWMTIPHVNIHDGTTHVLDHLTIPVVVQTFEIVFQSTIDIRNPRASLQKGIPAELKVRAYSGDIPSLQPAFI